MVLLSDSSFEEDHKLIARHEQSPGIYFVLRGKLEARYKSEDCVVDVVDENEYLGDFCLINRKSHVDYVCKYPVVCLFISIKALNEILLESKPNHKLATATAKLRLKYLVYLKNQTYKARKEYDNFISSKKELEFDEDVDFSDEEKKKGILTIQNSAKHGPIETEGEHLLTETETMKDGKPMIEKLPLLITPKKSVPLVPLDKTPSTTEVLQMKQDRLKNEISLLKTGTLNKMKTAWGKTGGQLKKASLLHVVAMADVTEDLEDSSDSEPEKVDFEEEAGQENGDDSDFECSEADESIEMDDPIASMKFKEILPQLEGALRLISVTPFFTRPN